jgi:hypothetical protein
MPAWTARCSMPLKLSWIIETKTSDQPWVVSCSDTTLPEGPLMPAKPVIFIDSQVKLC